MEDITIRQFVDSDQEAVWNLHIAWLQQTGSYVENTAYDSDLENIAQNYINNAWTFLVATHHDKVIGMGAVRKIDASTAEIKRMRVDLDYQGNGIGSQILDKLIEVTQELLYQKLILDTSVNQIAAQKLYESRWFVEYKREVVDELICVFYEKML